MAKERAYYKLWKARVHKRVFEMVWDVGIAKPVNGQSIGATQMPWKLLGRHTVFQLIVSAFVSRCGPFAEFFSELALASWKLSRYS